MPKKATMRDRAKAHFRKGKATEADDDEQELDEEEDEGGPTPGERAILKGGPGQADDDQTDDDSSDEDDGQVEMVIGGKRFRVTKELAETIQSDRHDPNEMARIRRELEELKAGRARPETKKEDGPDQDDELAEQIFTDPKKAIKAIRAQAVEEATKKVTDAYVEDQAEKAFWSGFYGKYKELADVDWLVKQTLKDNQDQLVGLSVSKGAAKLAELTEQKMKSLVKKVAPGPGNRPKTRSVAESDEPSPRRQQPVEPTRSTPQGDRPMTITDILRLRKQERRKAATRAFIRR